MRDISAGERAGDAEAIRAIRMDASAWTSRVLAHEVANYLGTIRTMAHLLADEIPPDSEAKQDVDSVVEAVEAGTRFLEAIRAFVHAAPLGTDPAELNAVVRGIEADLRRAAEPRARLALRLADGAGWVRGDPGRLGRVVLDLVHVAAVGVPPGGEVTVETASDAAATVVVRAGGRGYSADDLARIFEPFVADRGYDGGLRLPAVYAVLKLSGGSVTVDSAPGAGVRFRVGLPASSPAA